MMRRKLNTPMVIRIIGWLLMIEAFIMLFPTMTCVLFEEADWLAFSICTGATFAAGLLLARGVKVDHRSFGKRDSFLLTSLVWVVFSVFGMLPFIFCTTPISVSDAFFESMSGFTTTGASVLQSIEHMSHGVHLWRAMMQWIGGMGIILFTLAIIPHLNSAGGLQMFNAEVTGITVDKVRPRISQTAKSLWLLYIILTVILVFLLWLGPMNLFESVCHAFGTISTGGFSTKSGSIAEYDSNYVKFVVLAFMFVGGVNFSLIIKTISGSWSAIWRNDVFRGYVVIVSAAYVLFALSIIAHGQVHSWEDVTINPIFQIVSTITSTGYTCTNFESWGTFVLSLTFVLMFCGACAGSTSGGAKVDRVLFLVKNVRNEMHRCVYPNAVMPVRINGKVVSPDLVSRVIAFLCIYVLVMVAGGVVLTALGMPLIDSFFSSFSCISNVGLGAGITGYGGSYELVPDVGKWVLAFLMLIGRLELFTVLVLMTKAFWHR